MTSSSAEFASFFTMAQDTSWFDVRLAEVDELPLDIGCSDANAINYPRYPSGLWHVYHGRDVPYPPHMSSSAHPKPLDQLLTLDDALVRSGVARTVGTLKDAIPPKLSVLIRSFTERHRPDTAATLSKGARALSKHCLRDQSHQFWGQPCGGDAARNAYALDVLMNKIMTDVAWCNIYFLDDATNLLEVRNSRGYGMRWSADGSQFRGFIEPQAEDGHDNGWVH